LRRIIVEEDDGWKRRRYRTTAAAPEQPRHRFDCPAAAAPSALQQGHDGGGSWLRLWLASIISAACCARADITGSKVTGSRWVMARK
jgi:hypothetical protein